jgi:hypothetical protein
MLRKSRIATLRQREARFFLKVSQRHLEQEHQEAQGQHDLRSDKWNRD